MKEKADHTVGARQRQRELKQMRKGNRTKTTINMSATTKEHLHEGAQALYMNHSDFIEWLLNKYAKGLVIVAEEGAFVESMMKAVEDLAAKKGAVAGEKAALRVLYDRGLIDSDLLK